MLRLAPSCREHWTKTHALKQTTFAGVEAGKLASIGEGAAARFVLQTDKSINKNWRKKKGKKKTINTDKKEEENTLMHLYFQVHIHRLNT